MTDNALKIAIAKALGWTAHRNGNSPCGSDIPECEAYIWEHHFVPPRFSGDPDYWRVLHDWPHDLNACHEMEKALPEDKKMPYANALKTIVRNGFGYCTDDDFYWVHATARQRCEAFVLAFSA